MAKKSAIEKNNRRRRIAAKFAAKRNALREIANDQTLPAEERFAARLKLSQLPRNSAPARIRNRCEVTGRPRAFYRKYKMSRIALRDLASTGRIPGMVKSSW
ncbi:MAG: 30S ribosomal protein S14 [Rhodospirillaceae bacterium]|nr:30S ribosomal protein S14 [Rhodospirillaceae bacterium]HAA90829.1 30S ribosomal protein S14 [Rhodospirillaceae bacterium]